VTLLERSTIAVADALAIAVTDPIGEPEGKRDPSKDPFVIAVGRVASNTEHCKGTDYCYYTPQEVSPVLLLLPFTGEATNIPSPITGVQPNGEIKGLRVEAALYADNQGSLDPVLTPAEPIPLVPPKVSALPGGTGLKWKFPYDKEPTHREPALTESLKFGPTGDYNDAELWFNFNFVVPVEAPDLNPYEFGVCSGGLSTPSEKCKTISRLKFSWHCLGAGTQVTLADGSTKRIEEIENLYRVQTGMGGTLGVEATTRGLHRDGERPNSKVFRLETEQGRELTLSAVHPVITPEGPLAAMDLRPGDEVLTAAGRDAVKACKPVPYEGLVFNLMLVDEDDRARGVSAPFASFLANGIVVGDFESQAAHSKALRHDPDYMKARLPRENHTDLESALADIAAAS
jgi:hypothetical protein